MYWQFMSEYIKMNCTFTAFLKTMCTLKSILFVCFWQSSSLKYEYNLLVAFIENKKFTFNTNLLFLLVGIIKTLPIILCLLHGIHVIVTYIGRFTLIYIDYKQQFEIFYNLRVSWPNVIYVLCTSVTRSIARVKTIWLNWSEFERKKTVKTLIRKRNQKRLPRHYTKGESVAKPGHPCWSSLVWYVNLI